MKSSLLTALVLAACSICGVSQAQALDRGMFGWRAEEVVGTRPLLVIWLHEPDGTPSAELAKYQRYYHDEVFGETPGPAAARDGALRFERSFFGYFREVSRGKFSFTSAGVVGPLAASVRKRPAEEIARLALEAAAGEGRFDFRRFDAHHDGRITSTDLSVLVIANLSASAGQRPDLSSEPQSVPIEGQNVAFAGPIAVVGENDGFGTVALALLRMIAPDVQPIWGPPHRCFVLNTGLSLLGGEFSERIVHLDPWHKMLLGWTEPRIFTTDAPGEAKLIAQHITDEIDPKRRAPAAWSDWRRPVLIYDPVQGPSEFFLLEYRTRSRLGFDQDQGTSGLVIWQVALDAGNRLRTVAADRKNCKGETLNIPGLFVRGAPDWTLGLNRAYTTSSNPVSLKRMDGTDTGVRLTIAPHHAVDWMLSVAWSRPNAAGPD
jgi:hypothetical protein